MSREEGDWRLGTCQIQVKSLEFKKQLLRRCRKKGYRADGDLRSATAAYALNKFLPVLVYSDQIEGILSLSDCSLSDLVQPRCGNYRKIFTTEKLICLHGWRRWKAASNVDPDMWWTVNLLCAPRGVDELALFRDIIEDGGDEIPWSDGDIYRKFRFYKDQPCIAEQWKQKLTTSKKVALGRLKETTYLHALDKLLMFPGLGAGLELGNVERELALRSPYELNNNLDFIFQVWDYITLGDPHIRDAVDEKTVEALELRVPTCSADREYICDAMRTKSILGDIGDLDLRHRVESRILELRSTIPSIKTFHANMRYFGTGIRIIRQHLLGGKLQKGESVFDSINKLWQNPTQCIVEYEEGDFVELPCPANPRFAYEQVLVAAWRHFPGLSGERPKAEGRKQSIPPAQEDPSCAHKFLCCVRNLGFNSPMIQSKIRNTMNATESQTTYSHDGRGQDYTEDSPRRRCGRPYENSFKRSRGHLFLWKLYCLDEDSAHFPTSLAVQRDIILPFFKRDTAEAALACLKKARGILDIADGAVPRHQSEEANDVSFPYNNPSWPRHSVTRTESAHTPCRPLSPTIEHASKVPSPPGSMRSERSQSSPARSLVEVVSSLSPTPAVVRSSWDRSDQSTPPRSLIGVTEKCETLRVAAPYSWDKSDCSTPSRFLIGVILSANTGDVSANANSTRTFRPSLPTDAPLTGLTEKQLAFVDIPTLNKLTGGS